MPLYTGAVAERAEIPVPERAPRPGTNGSSARTSPPTTRRIGYGTWSPLATSTRTHTATSSARMSSMPNMRTARYVFVPTAQWYGSPQTIVPSLVARLTLSRNCVAASDSNPPATRPTNNRKRSGERAAVSAPYCGPITRSCKPAATKRRYRVASAQPCSSAPAPETRAAARQDLVWQIEDSSRQHVDCARYHADASARSGHPHQFGEHALGVDASMTVNDSVTSKLSAASGSAPHRPSRR